MGRDVSGTARRTARIAALVAAPMAAVLGLSACGAGQIAQTATVQPDVTGNQGKVGQVLVIDAGVATPDGGSYDAGSPLKLHLYIVNQSVEADELVSVTIDGVDAVVSGTEAPAAPSSSPTSQSSAQSSSSAESSGSSSASSSAAPSSPAGPAASPIPLPAQTMVEIGKKATITVPSAPKKLYPAELVPATFVFKNAGTLQIQLPVGTSWDESPAPSSSFNFEGETAH